MFFNRLFSQFFGGISVYILLLLVCVICFLGVGNVEAYDIDMKQSVLVIDGVTIGDILTQQQDQDRIIQTYISKNKATFGVFDLFELDTDTLVPDTFQGGEESTYIGTSKRNISEHVSRDMEIGGIDELWGEVRYDVQSYVRTYMSASRVDRLGDGNGGFSMIGQLLILPRREDAYMMVM